MSNTPRIISIMWLGFTFSACQEGRTPAHQDGACLSDHFEDYPVCGYAETFDECVSGIIGDDGGGWRGWSADASCHDLCGGTSDGLFYYFCDASGTESYDACYSFEEETWALDEEDCTSCEEELECNGDLRCEGGVWIYDDYSC